MLQRGNYRHLMDFLAQGMLGINKLSLEGDTLFESEEEKKSPSSSFLHCLPIWDVLVQVFNVCISVIAHQRGWEAPGFG